MKVWSEQSINKDFTEELIRVAKRINFLIMNPPLGMNRDAREYARNKQCWENIQKEDIQWTKKLDSYLISSSEYNKLEKIEKEKTLKIEELDLVNKIENAPVQIWQQIEDWVNAQNMIKLTGSDSILLRDAKGMKEIFTPTIGQSKRLLDIYDLVKEYGFEGEI